MPNFSIIDKLETEDEAKYNEQVEYWSEFPHNNEASHIIKGYIQDKMVFHHQINLNYELKRD
jgi:hypothetical protein